MKNLVSICQRCRYAISNRVALLAFAALVLTCLAPGPAKPVDLPDALSVADWSSIRAEYERHRHAAYEQGDGGFRARNDGQQWTASFDGRGFLVEPDHGGWRWGLELSAYGWAGRSVAVEGRAPISTDVQRISYAWDGALEEWYVNDERGLEHGFTVRRAPAGTGDKLEIELRVRGELQPRVSGDGRGADFVDASGGAALRYAGLHAWDADGRVLEARLALQDGDLRIEVGVDGARYPVTVDPIVQQAYLKASNAQADDYFGWSVAISGDTVVVGAYGEDSAATVVNGDQSDNSASGAGAAYVFVRSSGGWSQQAYLKASNAQADDSFGRSIAISGDTVVVGAHSEDSTATGVNGNESNNSANLVGAAYVFVRSGGVWSQQAYLKASNAQANDRFGWSVAISGDTVAVGAFYESSAATGVNGDQSDNSAFAAGAAYVFVRSGVVWSQQAYLKASNPGVFDRFGYSVAISGDTVVVGADWESSAATGVNGDQSDNSASRSGAAYVFVRSGGAWSQQAYLKASNTEANDWFGWSVAISGDTVVVGASQEGSAATGVNGNESDNSAGSAGAAYVFVRSGGVWSRQAYLKASNAQGGDVFGDSVAISGDTVVVGASRERSAATGVNGNESNNSAVWVGAAYVFVRSGGAWGQQAYLKASNAQANDQFGLSVAISGDTIAVGAYREGSAATGVNGNESDNSASSAGAAYVFDAPPQQPLRVRGKASGLYWHNNSQGDKLVSTLQQPDDDDTLFTFERQSNGSYRLLVRSNGFPLHVDPSLDDALSTRYGALPSDDLCTQFTFEQQADLSYKIKECSGRYLREGADQLLDSVDQTDDDAARFYIEPAPGRAYRIRDKRNKALHTMNDPADMLLSIRYDVDDGSSRFFLEQEPDFSYRMRVDETGLYLHENGTNDKLLSTRFQTTDDYSRFYLYWQATDGSFRVHVKAHDRFWHVDGLGDQLISTRNQAGDEYTYFFFDLLQDCRVAINPSSTPYPADGGSDSFQLTTATGCPWTVSESLDWVTVTSPATGSGDATVSFDVNPNPSSLFRNGVIDVGGQQFAIFQEGVGCDFSIQPASRSFNSDGGVGTVDVITPPGCEWHVELPLDSWISITGPISGAGNGTVSYSVDPNPSASARVSGFEFTNFAASVFASHQVSQTGINCTYSISDPSQPFTSAGGSHAFNIVAPAGCAWTVSDDRIWITPAPLSGSGNQTINYSVLVNTTVGSKSGTITIKDDQGATVATHAVSQTGIACTYSISDASQPFTSAGGSHAFNIVAPAGCAWTVSDDRPWITPAPLSGSGNQTINYSVNANSTAGSRSGTITVKNTGGVTQATHAVSQSGKSTSSSSTSDLGAFTNGAWFLDRNGDFAFDASTEISGWGSPGDTPVRGDWNGDGFRDLGVFSGGTWFIDRNGDAAFDPATDIQGWGAPGWIPVTGDWNGDGKTDVGAVDPATMAWFLDLNGDFAFDPATEIRGWGSPGDTPVVGDWNGDGKDDVGVFSGGVWFIDFAGNGAFDPATDIRGWGEAGWTPVVGDWDGDGTTNLGAVSPSSTWFRDMNGDFGFDPATDITGWGSPGDTPVVGDWDGDGSDDIGVFSGGTWFIDSNGDGGFDPATDIRGWGAAGWTPVPGAWQ